MVSHTFVEPDGTRSPTGESMKGLLIYGNDDSMSVLITLGDSPDLDRGSKDLIAYGGRYSLGEGKVYHHVEVAARESRVGGTEKRQATLSGDRLVLHTPASEEGYTEVVWEKIRA
jgi:hypothetical protein